MGKEARQMDLKKLWPTLIPVLGILIEQFSGVIGPFLASNPTVSLLVMTVVTALANVVKSPTQPK